MSERAVIKPEDCPEPYWHETHRLCPICTWTESQKPSDDVEEAAATIHGAHVGWLDAAGVCGDARAGVTLVKTCEECKALARLILSERPHEGGNRPRFQVGVRLNIAARDADEARHLAGEAAKRYSGVIGEPIAVGSPDAE